MSFIELAPFLFALTAAAALIGLWLILRVIRKKHLLRKLFEYIGAAISAATAKFLRRFGRAGREGGLYDEQRESLFGSGRLGAIWRRMRDDARRARELREVPWERLESNRERARYIYRHFVRNCVGAGFRHDQTRTPNQSRDAIAAWRPDPAGAEAAMLTPIYNLARYGPDMEDIDDSLIKEAKSAAKELELK